MSKNTVAVVVGRFQVDNLTNGHNVILCKAYEDHKKMLVVIGEQRTPPNATNPLPYDARAKMIRKFCLANNFEDVNVVGLSDYKSNEVWSQKLDKLIKTVCGNATPILYCGRDSFRPYYTGQYECVELSETPGCATDVRNSIAANPTFESQDFRAGIIYAHVTRKFQTYNTVDCALLRNDGNGIDILLGRKPLEDKFRLPGGFIEEELNETFAEAAARELKEETNCISETGWEIVKDYPVPDEWRIRRQRNVSHRTILMQGWFLSGHPRAGDDLAEVKWMRLKDVVDNLDEVIVEGHHKIMIQDLYTRVSANTNV